MLSLAYSRWTCTAVSLNGDGILRRRMLGAEIEKSREQAWRSYKSKAEVDVIDGLSPYKEKGSGATIS